MVGPGPNVAMPFAMAAEFVPPGSPDPPDGPGPRTRFTCPLEKMARVGEPSAYGALSTCTRMDGPLRAPSTLSYGAWVMASTFFWLAGWVSQSSLQAPLTPVVVWLVPGSSVKKLLCPLNSF